MYKANLKLHSRERSCQLAKLGWPLLHERYLPLELIGVGGFAEVYKAFDLDTLGHVAVKVSFLLHRSSSLEAN